LNWFVEIIAVSSLGGCAGHEERLFLGVVFAGEAVVVPFGAVDFDDQVVVGPAEVGDQPAALNPDRLVDVGTLKPGIENEVEHGVLELAAGRCVAGGEDLPEVGDARAGAEAVEGGQDLVDGDEVALGFADRASQRAVVEGWRRGR
jgi:hypothetical protein